MKLLQNPSFVHRNQVTYNEQNDKHTAVMPHDKRMKFLMQSLSYNFKSIKMKCFNEGLTNVLQMMEQCCK